MRRFIAYLVLFLIIALAGGFVAIGLFPPEPVQQPMERVLPNENFQTR